VREELNKTKKFEIVVSYVPTIEDLRNALEKIDMPRPLEAV
jgi:hypothetical protein